MMLNVLSKRKYNVEKNSSVNIFRLDKMNSWIRVSIYTNIENSGLSIRLVFLLMDFPIQIATIRMHGIVHFIFKGSL